MLNPESSRKGIDLLFPVPAELPPPNPVRVSPRYIVLDNSADLVLEARFRGNFRFHDWVYSENDPYLRGFFTFFKNATKTNIGQLSLEQLTLDQDFNQHPILASS